MKALVTAMALCASLVLPSARAQLGRRGGNVTTNVGNRSVNTSRNFNGNTVNRSASVNGNTVNRSASVNGNTVNRNTNVNGNVNVNRSVNVNANYHGGCYNCYDHDSGWNWGSFAAGAATGAATTAAVGAATRPPATVAVGTVVPALPGGCATVQSGGAVIYHCSNVYYRPYYQGTTLVYRVVTYP
jgi:hypothetical protein